MSNLSDRIRPDCEAAPWVIEAVKELESRLKRAEEVLQYVRSSLEEIETLRLQQSEISTHAREKALVRKMEELAAATKYNVDWTLATYFGATQSE